MALEPPNDSVAGVLAVDPDEGPLMLSTIHSAKGLEWHSVFIIWALEGRFPSFYNINTDEELEEERRLLLRRRHAGQRESFHQLSDQNLRPRAAHGLVAPFAIHRGYLRRHAGADVRSSMRNEIGVGRVNHGAISAQYRRFRERRPS